MSEFPWAVVLLVGFGLAGVAYICIAIIVYASRE